MQNFSNLVQGEHF